MHQTGHTTIDPGPCRIVSYDTKGSFMDTFWKLKLPNDLVTQLRGTGILRERVIHALLLQKKISGSIDEIM